MEKRTFEDEIKKSFQNAEAAPPAQLWDNIEADLIRAESKKMRRVIVWYKWAAAASVAFAVFFASAYYVEHQRGKELVVMLNEKNQIASGSSLVEAAHTPDQRITDYAQSDKRGIMNPTSSNSDGDRLLTAEGLVSEEAVPSAMMREPLPNDNKSRYKNDSGALDNGVAVSIVSGQEMNSNDIGRDAQFAVDNRKLPVFHTVGKINNDGLLPQPEVVDPVAVMLAMLEQHERELADERPTKHKARKEGLWASFGMAAGTFSNNSSSTSGTNTVTAFSANGFADSHTVTENESKASGNSYNMGLVIGGKVRERWVIQGGVNYMAQNSNYEANGVVGSADLRSFRAATIAELATANKSALDEKYVTTAPYRVNNTMQFITVPLQAGFIAVNRKVGVQVNAGFSTDLFMQSVSVPDGSGLEKSTTGRGPDSPYRPVNFSGLIGTEVSYRFGQRFRLAVVPGMRHPFNSIYKSNVGASANPLVVDLGLRLKYFFF